MAGPRVGLFVTCLVDLFRPAVGFSTVKLLQEAGCEVIVPRHQTCCGQPGYNSGDRASAAAIAAQVIAAFESFDYIVAPSGSCAGMIKHHYPQLVDEALQARAQALAAKTYELLSFLTDVLQLEQVSNTTETTTTGVVTYHDSCSGLRELGIKKQPRQLLAAAGVTVQEMTDSEVCCGFGGTFCVKYPDISNRMVSDKIDHISATGADTVLAGDLGCLLNIAGKLQREQRKIAVRHVAEVLAGYDGADICATDVNDTNDGVAVTRA